MSKTERLVWLIFLVPLGLAAAFSWLAPNGLMVLAVMLLIGIVIELTLPAFLYVLAAYLLNLCIAKWRLALRLPVTILALAALGLSLPALLDLPQTRLENRLKGLDLAPSSSAPVRSLAIYEANRSPLACDLLCQHLLFQHQVDHIDIGQAPAGGEDAFPATVEFVRYSVEKRDDCPELPKSPVDFIRSRHFRLTGECLMVSAGDLTDDDIVITRGLASGIALPNDATAQVDTAYRRGPDGFKPVARRAYYSLKAVVPFWLPFRHLDMSGSGCCDLEVLTHYRRTERPVNDLTWLETDMATTVRPETAVDFSPMRVRLAALLASPAPAFSKDDLDDIHLYMQRYVGPYARPGALTAYRSAPATAEGIALVKRILSDARYKSTGASAIAAPTGEQVAALKNYLNSPMYKINRLLNGH